MGKRVSGVDLSGTGMHQDSNPIHFLIALSPLPQFYASKIAAADLKRLIGIEKAYPRMRKQKFPYLEEPINRGF